MDHPLNLPYVKILEQPDSKAIRFRYMCEGRFAGSIPGASSTPGNRTYPTIQVMNYTRPAIVIISCVTKDFPYRPHPHNIIGKDYLCTSGVCTREIMGNVPIEFQNMGIQCVKKSSIYDSLKIREENRIDPFRTGYQHKNDTSKIDVNVIRLCFQVFIEGNIPGRFNVQLKPIVSQPIFDKKALYELSIVALSHKEASVIGGKEMILLCEKVVRDDIEVRFFEEGPNETVLWEGFGKFEPKHVHKQYGICFKTPRYQNLDIEEPKEVFLQLRRPSDGARSEAEPFTLYPIEPGPDPNECPNKKELAKRKRSKFSSGLSGLDCEMPESAPESQCFFPPSEVVLSPLTTTPSSPSFRQPPIPTSVPHHVQYQPQWHVPCKPNPIESQLHKQSEKQSQQWPPRGIAKPERRYLEPPFRRLNDFYDNRDILDLSNKIYVRDQEDPLKELDVATLRSEGIDENISGSFSGLSIA